MEMRFFCVYNYTILLTVSMNFLQTIKSIDAWNSPENSTDGFPHCHFEISHVDKMKQAFFCVITASHGKDSARAEIVEYFQRVSKRSFLLSTKQNKIDYQTKPPFSASYYVCTFSSKKSVI